MEWEEEERGSIENGCVENGCVENGYIKTVVECCQQIRINSWLIAESRVEEAGHNRIDTILTKTNTNSWTIILTTILNNASTININKIQYNLMREPHQHIKTVINIK